jgi:hypothetical protein
MKPYILFEHIRVILGRRININDYTLEAISNSYQSGNGNGMYGYGFGFTDGSGYGNGFGVYGLHDGKRIESEYNFGIELQYRKYYY